LRTRRGDPSARHQISSAHLALVERDVEGQLLDGAETAPERSHRLWRIGNTNDLRQRSPPPGPRPRDISCSCHSQTLAPQEPMPQLVSLADVGLPMLTTLEAADVSTF
jgi:hypothetical protein